MLLQLPKFRNGLLTSSVGVLILVLEYTHVPVLDSLYSIFACTRTSSTRYSAPVLEAIFEYSALIFCLIDSSRMHRQRWVPRGGLTHAGYEDRSYKIPLECIDSAGCCAARRLNARWVQGLILQDFSQFPSPRRKCSTELRIRSQARVNTFMPRYQHDVYMYVHVHTRYGTFTRPRCTCT